MCVLPHRPGNGPTDDPALDTGAGPLHVLHRTHAGARRRFLAVNGVAFLVTALLSGAVGELFADRPASGMPLGAALGALQLTVLLLTSWWYDRALRRHADPLVDEVRRRAAHLPHSAQPQPGLADAMSGWPFPAPGRQR
ncbi:DUF485 domain-containing protein [Streptomyces sp. D2-8]|uniref:DUF485 domain-containing protein n=1 Tax=Streptomyces sp. D2-8 TaxID=2707767 RepID=UPI0020C123FF|nr:DUF485 domain-containing protein [Streptomyces sp. D2-8]MCK8435522.1 DUF485 domain-containing protein [Streptomyces sp. D2-8]